MLDDKYEQHYTLRNGPEQPPDHSFPVSSNVILWLQSRNKLDAPYKIQEKRGEDIIVLCDPPAGPTTFWSTSVRPFQEHHSTKNTNSTSSRADQSTQRDTQQKESQQHDISSLDRLLGSISENNEHSLSPDEFFAYLSHNLPPAKADCSPHLCLTRSAEFHQLLEQGLFSLT